MGREEQRSEPPADAFRILGPEAQKIQSVPRTPPRPERPPSAAAACSAALAASGGMMSALAGVWRLCPPLSGSLLACFCVCMQAGGWGAAAARRGLADAQLLNMATATRLLDGYSSLLMLSTLFSYVAHSCCLWGHKCITFFSKSACPPCSGTCSEHAGPSATSTNFVKVGVEKWSAVPFGSAVHVASGYCMPSWCDMSTSASTEDALPLAIFASK